MKIVSGTVSALRLPLVEEFAHALAGRAHSDSLLVEVVADSGVTGFGEGMPRPYVTGETVDASIEYVSCVLWPRVQGIPVPVCIDDADGLTALGAIQEALAGCGPLDGQPVIAWNAARCAVELALVDGFLKANSLSLGRLLPPVRDHVVYCGVMPTGSIDLAERHARIAKLMGARHLKIKVGAADIDVDRRRLAAVRHVVGRDVALTVDANASYTVDEAVRALREFEPFGIGGAEQPIPRSDPRDLAAVRGQSAIPIIVDESLVTLEDARTLIHAGACDVFSIRVSKCGGIVPSMEIAHLAEEHDIGVKVGCHVGESALLSAAGRHLAAHLPSVASVEGSFGTLMLEEDIAEQPIHFGHGGRAPLLRRPGLGVDVVSSAVERHASCRVRLGLP